MVKQQRRTDRSFPPAAGNSVTWVRFPVGSTHRRHLTQQVEESTTEEERGGAGPDGCSGDTKRARLDGSDEAAALTNREKVSGSCGQPGSERCRTEAGISSRPPPPDQQGSAEKNDNSRAAELQSVRSLQVTIQQTSESREFGQTDRSADRQTGGLLCHVCDVTCVSLQVFQDHMTGPEHLRKLREMTHSINTHTLQDRGCRPDVQCWCDTCRTHFSGDIIVHRRTKQHKMCKQLCRPFCPVCKRHFRTPRKFVEHMKSAEHKEQVHQEEVQEEELITVDAIGCFKEGEEEEEDGRDKEEEEEKGDEEEDGRDKEEDEGDEDGRDKEEEEGDEEEDGRDKEGDEEVEVAEEEDGEGVREEEEPNIEVTGSQETDREEYDPHTIYGSSYVLPVSGFLCRLCNKFFYREMTARHTHCRTHTHYVNLKSHRAQRRPEDQDAS